MIYNIYIHRQRERSIESARVLSAGRTEFAPRFMDSFPNVEFMNRLRAARNLWTRIYIYFYIAIRVCACTLKTPVSHKFQRRSESPSKTRDLQGSMNFETILRAAPEAISYSRKTLDRARTLRGGCEKL